MIICTGYLTIDPAKRAEAEAAIATLVAATTAEEGNVEYRYASDLGDPNRINILEIWESEDAMNAHMATDHLAEFMGTIVGFLGGPAEVMRHDVASSTKLI
jgi:quinol monooxygenase YgiN